jgi:hypothetical protein
MAGDNRGFQSPIASDAKDNETKQQEHKQAAIFAHLLVISATIVCQISKND